MRARFADNYPPLAHNHSIASFRTHTAEPNVRAAGAESQELEAPTSVPNPSVPRNLESTPFKTKELQ